MSKHRPARAPSTPIKIWRVPVAQIRQALAFALDMIPMLKASQPIASDLDPAVLATIAERLLQAPRLAIAVGNPNGGWKIVAGIELVRSEGDAAPHGALR